jgi:hypothetical protein
VRDPLKFKKRSQLFIRSHNETLPVIAVCINNPERSPFGIDGWDPAQTPASLAEFVGNQLPIFHWRILTFLLSTQQSQNDMKGRNDAGDNIRHCRDCASLHCGNTAARNFRFARG